MSRSPRDSLVVRVAPRFHHPIGLAPRLEVGGAVARDDGTGWRPLGDWSAPAQAAIARLIREPRPDCAQHVPDLAPDEIGLIRFPEHLRALWWRLAEGDRIDAGQLDEAAFAAFASAALEFLRFKHMPVPERSLCEVVLSPAGRESTGLAAAGANPGATVRCAVNLGDQRTYLFLPTTAALQQGSDARGEPNGPVSLVRIHLGPGDGLWLPDGAVIDGWTVGDADPAILLLLRSG